ncbi:hypothetical protein QUA42_11570 [Microcoleus sp. Pol11C2]
MLPGLMRPRCFAENGRKVEIFSTVLAELPPVVDRIQAKTPSVRQ